MGSQPIANEDETLWIVYNGEIFNHASLRPPLEAAAHRYRTHCDTETILHSFEQHGPASVEQFRGMFAFALWDKRRRTLFCARDRLGIKPFYYYWDGTVFAFASEIKALLEQPSISPHFEDSLLPEYLAFGYYQRRTNAISRNPQIDAGTLAAAGTRHRGRTAPLRNPPVLGRSCASKH